MQPNRYTRAACAGILAMAANFLGPGSATREVRAQAGDVTQPDAAGFSQYVQPFFAKNCYSCHSTQLKTGGLDLESLTTPTAITQNPELVGRILGRLHAGEMPPRGMARPNEADLKLAMGWMEGELERSSKAGWGLLARRLNRVEYNNTVRDLLGVEIDAANEFPPDDSAYGFDNMAQALSISPLLMEKYLAAAEKISRTAIFGPDVKSLTSEFLPPLPRRMETTNRTPVQLPAYYSMFDYDATGLSHPGALHLNYRFPADGEYLIQIHGAGFRPEGSEPGEVNLWLDGKLVRTFEISNDVENPSFERRPDQWDVRMRIPAGMHELVVAFPRQYHGLPVNYGGPNPSKLPLPPPRDPCRPFCLADLLKMPPETTPEGIEKRKQEIERARQAVERVQQQAMQPPRPFPGMAVHELDIVGPFDYAKRPLAESLKKIYVCGQDGFRPAGCERDILSSLARRAFRRPVTDVELRRLLSVFAEGRKRSGSFDEGIAVALNAILISPHFLFRIENRPEQPVGTPARQYELASRLSYFLWSSMPDDDLFRAAEQGNLHRPEVLGAQVRRMLADSKSTALVENFTGQWLETRRMNSAQPDRERYPDFDEYLRGSMIRETELFFEHIMDQDLSILDFIDAPYTFLNERLARHYGIRGVTGTQFRKVDLTGTGRAGILTHASVLTVSSYGNRTSPVLRGKWILENVLNAPPPPPPANVPSLDEDKVGISASLREQLEEHRRNAVCASCHARMDPLGFGLENYDAVGSWRTQDGNFAIDSSGTLPDGKSFRGADGLRTMLKQEQETFAEAVTEKLLMYALGRGVDSADRPAVRAIATAAATGNYKFSSLIIGIVNSDPFLGGPASTSKGEVAR